jgi:dTDP-4-dehydrorhamnose 3,5-epimerase
MIFTETTIPGVYVLDPERHADERGFFTRTFCADEYLRHGLDPRVTQTSASYNPRKHTLRGLHYQAAPHEEARTVRCVRGAIHDVVVDLRPGSPTHRRWLAVELTADNGRALYVPAGVAHGFLTLVDATEIHYAMSVPFAPDAGRGVRWDDPALAIPWPFPPRVISARDAAYPGLEP